MTDRGEIRTGIETAAKRALQVARFDRRSRNRKVIGELPQLSRATKSAGPEVFLM